MQIVNILDVPQTVMDEARTTFESLGYSVVGVAEENGNYALHLEDQESDPLLELIFGLTCSVVMLVPQDGGYHAVLAEETTPERQAFVNTAGKLFHAGEEDQYVMTSETPAD